MTPTVRDLIPGGPNAAPIGATIPAKRYPHLRLIVKELDFACSNCSAGYGRPVYRVFEECMRAGSLDPISGPNGYHTRFGLRCPECNTSPTDGPFIENGVIDLMRVPHNYKRPKRVSNSPTGGIGVRMEDVDADEELKATEPVRAPKGSPKRETKLGSKVKTVNAKAKKARLSKAGDISV